MQKIQLDPTSSLGKEELLKILKSHFESQGYKVDNTKLPGSDFYIRKSAWIGALVSLKEKKDTKFVRTHGYSPSIWARLLVKPFIASIFIGKKWKRIEEEIATVVNQNQLRQEKSNRS